MPWKCPACSTPIRRELTAAGHDTPQSGRVYICMICRLQLVLSDDASCMAIAPISPEPTK
jgi:hypothetical protein